jgi:hypothetical protein
MSVNGQIAEEFRHSGRRFEVDSFQRGNFVDVILNSDWRE